MAKLTRQGIYMKVSDELKSVRKEKRQLAKKERELLLETKIEKDMQKWRKIGELKADCNKLIKDADLGMRMNLTKLDRHPEYYIYQHPVHKKQKTGNRDEQWVKEYIGDARPQDGGITGTIEDLIGCARKSRLASWKRMLRKEARKKKYTKDDTTDATKGKSNKSGKSSAASKMVTS